MEKEPRDLLLEFVESGNVRDADFQEIPPERALALRERLDLVRTDDAGPSADANPSDFIIALREREEEAEAAKGISRGKDVPRFNEDKPGFRQFYQAHDTVATLPAPGGLGTIIIIIAIFWLILIPATSGGETRALLLWEVLLGKKKIEENVDLNKLNFNELFNAGGGDTSTQTGGGFSGDGQINGMPPPVVNAPLATDPEYELFSLVPRSAGIGGGL